MNFEYFDRLLLETACDEVKVIGRDVVLEGHCVHIIGMTRKGKQAFVYGLELVEHPDSEEEDFQTAEDKTYRQQMKERVKNKVDFGAHLYKGS